MLIHMPSISSEIPTWAKGVHGAFEPAAAEALRAAVEMERVISICASIDHGALRFEIIASSVVAQLRELKTKVAEENLAPIAAATPKGVLEIYPPLRGLVMSPHLVSLVNDADRAAIKRAQAGPINPTNQEVSDVPEVHG